ncbi:hypothetical protein F4824DRAFT_390642 [Ustulina deusta]|nr:hypothetical protein F4824DRAFT_390642 [Ustulina deusta]
MSPSQQPPPLPPRSPRPPVTGDTPSPQHPSSGFPPPPPELPPRPSAVLSSPAGPPPPLPPRPSGYEIRTPSNPTTPLTRPPSTGYAPSSPDSQPGLHFPLPPPPYTASVADVSLSPHYPPHPELTGPNSAHSLSPSPVSGVPSPTGWTKFPPPPPGPPPQPSSHLSPRIPQYSPTPSRPLSPVGAPVELPAELPASQSPSELAKRQDDSLGTSQTQKNDFQVSPSPAEKLPAYQPPVSILGTSPGAPNSSYSEKPSREGHSNPTPSSGGPSNETSNSKAEPFGGVPSTVPSQISPSTQHPPLEASFQSLHLTSVPPVPPKSPLAPNTTQNHSSESATSASGPLPGYSPSTNPAQAHTSHESPGKAAPPTPDVPPTPYSSSPQGAAPPPSRPVTSCIDIPITFSTDWYWHPEAPGYLVCSRCYADHIHRSQYRGAFQRGRFSDGKPRTCRFSKPRMKNHLYREALASGSLRHALDWMRKRAAIPDCRGVDGVKGRFGAGITWYATREIPGFLACQACYEDRLLTNRLAHRFGVHAETHPADAVWACDAPVPFIERVYEERGRTDDWQGFVGEAKARIAAQPCPQGEKVAAYGRKWFVPKAGPRDLILCSTCYCDQVVHSGEESKWEVARPGEQKVRCARGVFNIRILMAQAHEKKDFGLFWGAVDRLGREKGCDDDGIVDGVWHTLPSHAKGFGVCGACYVAILEPLNVARFWVRKADVPPAAKLLCCFNIAHPRLFRFVPRLLEMYFTHDPRALDEYASTYAAIPLCLRDEEKPGRRWYGWKGCTICPECYLDFARHSPLEQLMEFRDAPVAENRMCEMYSARMRKLYTERGSTSPPNVQPLLEYSARRRQVYVETVPKIRTILSQQRMALHQQKFPNTMGSNYAAAGQLDQITYGQQATGVAAGIGTGSHMVAVQQLEQRWKAVE